MSKLVLIALVALGSVAFADVPATPIYSCSINVLSKDCGTVSVAIPTFPEFKKIEPASCPNVRLVFRRYDPSRGADPSVGVSLIYLNAKGKAVSAANMHTVLADSFELAVDAPGENGGFIQTEAFCKISGYNK